MALAASAVLARLRDEFTETITTDPYCQPTAAYLITKYAPLVVTEGLWSWERAELVMFLRDVMERSRNRVQNAIKWGHDPLSVDYALAHICYVTLEGMVPKMEYPSPLGGPYLRRVWGQWWTGWRRCG